MQIYQAKSLHNDIRQNLYTMIKKCSKHDTSTRYGKQKLPLFSLCAQQRMAKFLRRGYNTELPLKDCSEVSLQYSLDYTVQ